MAEKDQPFRLDQSGMVWVFGNQECVRKSSLVSRKNCRSHRPVCFRSTSRSGAPPADVEAPDRFIVPGGLGYLRCKNVASAINSKTAEDGKTAVDGIVATLAGGNTNVVVTPVSQWASELNGQVGIKRGQDIT